MSSNWCIKIWLQLICNCLQNLWGAFHLEAVGCYWNGMTQVADSARCQLYIWRIWISCSGDTEVYKCDILEWGEKLKNVSRDHGAPVSIPNEHNKVRRHKWNLSHKLIHQDQRAFEHISVLVCRWDLWKELSYNILLQFKRFHVFMY
jgi:hypothetical protein